MSKPRDRSAPFRRRNRAPTDRRRDFGAYRLLYTSLSRFQAVNSSADGKKGNILVTKSANPHQADWYDSTRSSHALGNGSHMTLSDILARSSGIVTRRFL